jgi:hypothetical protein
MSEEDMAAMKFLEGFTAGGGLAYNTYQSAQPQTLTYALQDSPAGWLAWVTQFFQRSVEPDYIMVNASAYWLTNTIDSSIRRYYEVAHAEQPTEPTTTPPASRSSRTISRPSDASPSATTPTSSAGTATTAAATSHPTTPPTSYSATSGSSSAPCGDRRARSPRSVQPRTERGGVRVPCGALRADRDRYLRCQPHDQRCRGLVGALPGTHTARERPAAAGHGLLGQRELVVEGTIRLP